MVQHQFIFLPGQWLGEGQVTFSTSEETLKFHMQWIVAEETDSTISWKQRVQLAGVPEEVVNRLTFSSVSTSSFVVELSNEMVDKIQGTGLIEDNRVAWEYRGHPGFEGFETYELQDNGAYTLHAEYLSSEQFRTIIDGRIWKKGEKT